MTLLGMIRHGRTAWNEEGRLTGRADISLTEQGLAALAGIRPPKILDGANWHVSPLRRAQETARIIGCRNIDFRTDERLIEMDFGAYEGRTLIELRDDPAENMAVAHKSIIRAVFAEAYNWDMMGRPPVKLYWDRVHLFSIDNLCRLSPVRMNIPMQLGGEAN